MLEPVSSSTIILLTAQRIENILQRRRLPEEAQSGGKAQETRNGILRNYVVGRRELGNEPKS